MDANVPDIVNNLEDRFSGNKVLTMSSKMLVPELLLPEDLLNERELGVAGGEAIVTEGVRLSAVVGQALSAETRVWSGEGSDSRDEADVSEAQDEENKGVCVGAAFGHGLEAERKGSGGDEHVSAGFVVADGRSEAGMASGRL